MALDRALLMITLAAAFAAVPFQRLSAEDASTEASGQKPPEAAPARQESRAESWGPKEIRDLEDQAHQMEPELMKMTPAQVKAWLTIDAHGRNSYQQLKMLSIIMKKFTRKEWESIFGNSSIEGVIGLIGWIGHGDVGNNGLVEYIVPWTGNVRMLDAAHGRKDKTHYVLVVP